MKKILFVIAPVDYKDEEFEIPKKIIESSGFVITVANSTGKPSKSVAGKNTAVDLKLGDINSNQYDAIVFIGGGGAAVYFDNQDALKLAREFYEKGKIVCAICIAPTILANAGILDGKIVTAFPSEKEKISKVANYTGNDVEKDRNIITGKWPSAAEEFGKAIARALNKK